MTYVPKTLRLFFDIETEANPETCALIPEPVIEAPANYKDPEKIAQYITEKTEAAKTAALEKAALDADYGRILSIGATFQPDYEVSVFVVGDPCIDAPDGVWTEDLILSRFWELFGHCRGFCVGYNILNFDLPYLMRRSMALGVPIPIQPNLVRYRTEPVTDLMAILYNWGSERYKGLKQVAKLYGIPNRCPDVDGSKVKDLDRETLRAYQESDVRLVVDLYCRMNGIYFKH